MWSVSCFGVRASVMFPLCLFVILLVQFGLLSDHLLGNSCPLGKQFVLIVLCLFVMLIYFPFLFSERDLAFDCSSSCLLHSQDRKGAELCHVHHDFESQWECHAQMGVH